jgi:hypothetical protein
MVDASFPFLTSMCIQERIDHQDGLRLQVSRSGGTSIANMHTTTTTNNNNNNNNTTPERKT